MSKNHICLHLMRTNFFVKLEYNIFMFLSDEEQLEVAKGALHKCLLFEDVS